MEVLVRSHWRDFQQENQNLAEDFLTYFFSEFDEEKGIDYVFPSYFRYVEAFGRCPKFEKYNCEVAAKNLTALSSLCLIETADQQLIFGVKRGMDSKLSGFSGYIQSKYMENQFVNLYQHLADCLCDELQINAESIAEIVRIGQSYSPQIIDENGKLNNKVYHNHFLIKLTLSASEVLQRFQSNVEVISLECIPSDPKTIKRFMLQNEENVSSHCLGAVVNYLVYQKDDKHMQDLYEKLNHHTIHFSKKKGKQKTSQLLEEMNVFQWGLVGNKRIGQYSVAPSMWKQLFKHLNYPIHYLIVSGDSEDELKSKFEKAIEYGCFKGCNVAMPWKQLMESKCHTKSDELDFCNVINTYILENQQFKGYNTDGKGMVNVIKEVTQLQEKVIFIVGAGGASQTVPYHLLQHHVQKVFVYDVIKERSDNLGNLYNEQFKKKGSIIQSIERADLIQVLQVTDILIQASPCGMVGIEQTSPFDLEFVKYLKKSSIIAEMIYNPYSTPLLEEAKRHDLTVIPGIHMLVEQAALSFYYSFGIELDSNQKNIMKEVALAALSS